MPSLDTLKMNADLGLRIADYEAAHSVRNPQSEIRN
jgi:hypothetical protein